jgi:hypothetical protein
LIAVDGYEQLSCLSRWRLAWLCRRRRLGLLVTAHQPVGLPMLYRTQPGPELFDGLIERLLGDEFAPAWREAAAQAFAKRQGNVREALFDLYDVYETQRRSRRACQS